MGRVKRGSRGADNKADRVTTASSSGHREAFRAKRVPADWRRCFFSVQDVTNTVRVNFSLAKNWVSLSIRRPTWIRKVNMKSAGPPSALIMFFFISLYVLLIMFFYFNTC